LPLAEAAAQKIEGAATAAGEFVTFMRAARHALVSFSDTPFVAFIGLAIAVVLMTLALPIEWQALCRVAALVAGFGVSSGGAFWRVYRMIEPVLKRFMNVYRLVRGRRRGPELNAFLTGANGNPALFPAYQLWLAIEMGLNSVLTEYYREVLQSDLLASRIPIRLKGVHLKPESEREEALLSLVQRHLSVEDAVRHGTSLEAALEAIRVGGRQVGLADAAQEVRRFSLPRWTHPIPNVHRD
jgi:hypothetical protein